MIIEIREIPDQGLQLAGELHRDIFQLDDPETKPAGPVTYDLHVSVVTESILAQGEVSAPFEVHCVRCLEPFEYRVEIPDFVFSEPLEGRSSIDLTDSVREDILLALPIYPHCEDGVAGRECPAADRFKESEESPERSGGSDAWSGLEGLEPPARD